METGIHFENIWFDESVIELKITVKEGKSGFTNVIYVGYQELKELVDGLCDFKNHIHGGIFNIVFGEFGPEYANGAFYGRLHFQQRGKIYITVKMQSAFQNFGVKNVANEATLHLISEPALLDSFINYFREIDRQLGNVAVLECISK